MTIDFAGQDDVDAIGDIKRCGQSDVGGRSGGSGLGGGQRGLITHAHDWGLRLVHRVCGGGIACIFAG